MQRRTTFSWRDALMAAAAVGALALAAPAQADEAAALAAQPDAAAAAPPQGGPAPPKTPDPAPGPLASSSQGAKFQAANPSQSFLSQPGVTGDWGGVRTRLSNDGVDFFGSFQTQTGDVTSGGIRTGVDSNFQIILGANLDLQKLANVPGGTFTFALADRFGDNTSHLVGARVILDGNYGEGETFRVANLSFRQNLFNGRVAYQIGWFPAAAEFDFAPLLCSFLNQGLCGHPNSLGADSAGFQNPPGAQLGARLTVFPRKDLYVKFGLFEVNPPLFTTNYQGFRIFSTENSTGVISLVETGWSPTLHLGGHDLPGQYKIGAYYDSSSAPDVLNARRQRTGRYSGWLYGQQMIWAFEPTAKRGLYVFANATDANETNSPISTYYSTGFVAQGPFASRPRDVLSIGWAISNLNPRRYAQEIRAKPTFGYYDAEQYVDVSYKAQITPWLFITPDFQYLKNPGTFSAARYKNATVIGGATGVTF